MLTAACQRFGRKSAGISIAIVTDPDIRRLNKQFLGRERTTDVLSFDLSGKRGPKTFDLVVNGPLANKQAVRRGHSAESELALYILHGLLHNLGLDDDNPEKAREMHETEDNFLQEFGYGRVYNS